MHTQYWISRIAPASTHHRWPDEDNFPPDISVALGGVRRGPPSCLVDGIDCFVSSKQRAAVEHGIKPGKTNDIGPLLVIAGASWLRLIPTHHFRYP